MRTESTEQSLARLTHLYAALRTLAMTDPIDYEAAIKIAAQLRTAAFAIGDSVTADKAGLARGQFSRLRRRERRYAAPLARQLITALEDTRSGIRVSARLAPGELVKAPIAQ